MTKRKNASLRPSDKALTPVKSRAMAASDVPPGLAKKLAQLSAGRDPELCWNWPGHLSRGYGRWYGKPNGRGVHIQVHRAAYALTHGTTTAGLVVRHSCDNRACFNPKHLSEGPQRDNVLDMIDRGRTQWAGLSAEERKVKCWQFRPENNKSNKPVAGPDGRIWPSAAQAGEALGVTGKIIAQRCRRQNKGWRFA